MRTQFISNRVVSGIGRFFNSFLQMEWFVSGRAGFCLRVAFIIAIIGGVMGAELDHGLFQYTVRIVALLVLAGLCWMPKPNVASRAVSGGWIDRKIPWLVFALLIGALGYLEWREPFFFVQDDSHSYSLPMLVYAGRAVFDAGIFPTWSGYNNLGMPLATTGSLMLTYPLFYVAYAIARFLMGNELLVVDVYAWMHFMLGYVFGYRALRTLGVSRALSAAAIFSFLLLGYNLIAGRSWFAMLATLAWLPALGWSLAWLESGRPVGWRWVVATAGTIGIIFHASHAQDAVYATCFWGMGVAWVLLWNRRQCFTLLLPVLAATLGGIGIAMVIMLPQYLELRDVPRNTGEGGLIWMVKNMLLPYPLVTTVQGAGSWSGPICYSGSLFIWAFFAKVIADALAFGRHPLQSEKMTGAVFTVIGLAAFIYSFGPDGKLWDWLAAYPPFSKFRWPFRLLPFAVFFMTIAGALFLQSLIQRWRHGIIAAYGMTVLVLGLVVYNLTLPLEPFHRWEDKPYPALPPQLTALQADGFTTKGRGVPLGEWRSAAPYYTLTLKQNYPSYYKIPVISGYEGGTIEEGLPANRTSMEIFRRDPHTFHREYAIEWMGVPKPPVAAAEAVYTDTAEWLKTVSETVQQLPFLDVYFIAGEHSKPMVHSAYNPATPLPYKLEPNGIIVQLDEAASARHNSITLAFTYREWFRAWDERQRELQVRADKMQRIVVDTPPGTKKIMVRYSPPWRYGVMAAAVLISLAVLLTLVWRRRFNRMA